jgi:hypothetical protein
MASAAPAIACEEPSKPPEARSAGPGDEVPYEVPNTLEGARYTLTLDEEQLAGGTDPGGKAGISGSFTMPDLGGDARRVAVRIAVAHAEDEARWSTEMPLDYKPKPPQALREEPRSAGAPPLPAAAPPPGPAPIPPLAPVVDLPAVTQGAVKGVQRRSPAVRRIFAALGRLGPPARKRSARRVEKRARRRAAKRGRRTADLGSIGLRERGAPAEPAAVPGRPIDAALPEFGVPVAWRALLAFAIVGFLLVLTLRAVALSRARRRALTP